MAQEMFMNFKTSTVETVKGAMDKIQPKIETAREGYTSVVKPKLNESMTVASNIASAAVQTVADEVLKVKKPNTSPEEWYKSNTTKIKAIILSYGIKNLAREVLRDQDLLAFLVLSPAHIIRLEKYLKSQIGYYPDTLIRSAGGYEGITALRHAIDGVRIHFGATSFEKGWLQVTANLEQLLGENPTEGAITLRESLSRAGARFLDAKNTLASFEEQLLSISNYRFNSEYHLPQPSSFKWFLTSVLSILIGFFTKPLNIGVSGKTKHAQASYERVFLDSCVFGMKLFGGLTQCMFGLRTMAMGYFAVLTFANLVKFVGYWVIRQHFGVNWHRYVIFFMLIIISLCINAIINAKTVELQAVPAAEKKFMGILAFCVVVIHIFDVDLADAMGNSLNRMSRLVNMFIDNYRGKAHTASGVFLQAKDGAGPGELDMISDVMNIVLNINNTEFDEDCESASEVETFGSWVSVNQLSERSISRPLQYPVRATHALNTTNVKEVAEEIFQNPHMWCQVVGHTGCGKSTRLPAAYYNRLIQDNTGRRQRILICEPTRATTVNVVEGLSHNLNWLVYGKHRKWSNTGCMDVQVMTYGSALYQQLALPSFISSFDAVFLDESHLVTEHMLAFESLCQKEKSVRKIYVSATPRDGSSCPEATRRFPLTTHRTECNSVEAFAQAYGSKDSLDINDYNGVLVFLAGKAECENATHLWNRSMTTNNAHKAMWLHSDNFKSDYAKIVEKLADESERLIVFVTNILETGVTLNVDCVVDFGYTMRPVLDMLGKTLFLQRKRVTDNERAQRAGRAGRLKPGYAILCGKTEKRTNIVAPEVVYGAALLSFVHNLEFFIDQSVELSWLNGITKKQAAVMTQFTLPIFLMRDIVNYDGSIPEVLIPALQAFANNTLDMVSTKMPIASHVQAQWPQYKEVLAAQTRRGSKPDSPFRSARIPFVCPNIEGFKWEIFAEACKTFEPRLNRIFQDIGSPTRSIILQTNPANIVQTINYVGELHNVYLKAAARQLEAINQGKTSIFQSFRSCGMLNRAMGGLEDIHKRTKQNIDVCQKTLSTLRAMMNDQATEVDIKTCQQVEALVELQCRHELNVEETARVLGMTVPGLNLMTYAMANAMKFLTAFLFVVCTTLLWMVFRRYFKKRDDSEETHIFLEGKGKRHYQDKKLMYMTSEEQTSFEDFQTRVREKRSRLVRNIKPETRLTYKRPSFYSFYDFKADSEVVDALFYDVDGTLFYRTGNPNADIREAEAALQRHLGSKALPNQWADTEEEETHIYCRVKSKDGAWYEVDMTAHNDSLLRANGETHGYPEHDGVFRQTGSTRVVAKAGEENPPPVFRTRRGRIDTGVSLEGATELPQARTPLSCANAIGMFKIGAYSMNCYLYSDWIILPAHAMQKSGPVTLTFKHRTIETSSDALSEHGMITFPDRDLVLIKRPSNLPPVKKILNANEMHYARVIQMVYSTGNGETFVTQSDKCRPQDFDRWSHRIATNWGMCGCPVFDASDRSLVGVHTAYDGKTKRNEFQAFSRSIIDIMNSSPKYVEQHPWGFSLQDTGYVARRVNLQAKTESSIISKLNATISGFGFELNGKHVEEANTGTIRKFKEIFKSDDTTTSGSFELIGQMSSALITKHTIVGENDYFFDFLAQHPHFQWMLEYTCHYAPSVLDFEAYFKDVKKYNRQIRTWLKPQTQILQAAESHIIKVLERAGFQTCRVVSTDEMLADVQWSTACGAAYQGKKSNVLSHLEEQGKLNSFAEACREALLEGKSLGLWNGSMKAELRTIEKVKEKKTRVFTAAPITSLLAMKYYVDDFNHQFYGTHLKAPHTVGINKFNRGWEKLHTYLARPGWFYGGGDGSRFDSSIDPFLFEVVKRVRKYFLATEHHRAIDLIYDEIMNTPIKLSNGMVIRKKLGNNSGQPSTVVDNTLILMVCFTYAYISKTHDYACADIDKSFVFVCNGDDNKFAVSPHFVETYGADFSQELSELGLVYEFDDLTNDIMAFPYMSLTMVPTEYGVGFTLPPERIIAILQWGKKDGLLHAYNAGRAAAVEAFNLPRLFQAIYTYLVWLILQHGDDLELLMDVRGQHTPLFNPLAVADLHYNETPVCTVRNPTQLSCGEFFDDMSQTEHALALRDGVYLQAATQTTSERDINRMREGESGDVAPPPPYPSPDAGSSSKGQNGSLKGKEVAVWKQPTIKAKNKKTRIPLNVLHAIPEESIQQDNSVATENQVKLWEQEVRNDLGITTDEQWNSTLVVWIIWCAHNGTSDKTDPSQEFEIKDDLGAQTTVRVEPFVEHGRKNGGLRRIMRAFCFDAREIIKEKKVTTKWALKGGISPNDAMGQPYFDFYIPQPSDSTTFLNLFKQARLAAIGVGTENRMITADKVNMKRVTTERVADHTGYDTLY